MLEYSLLDDFCCSRKTRGQHSNWWLEEVPVPRKRGAVSRLPQQCQLVLVKMHKVQEMSNNFSNDINPFHVYDKCSPASLAKCRWWRDDDDDYDGGAKFAWATPPIPPASASGSTPCSCSSCGGVGFAGALVFSNVLSCTLWDVERQRNAKDGWVRKVLVVQGGLGWCRMVRGQGPGAGWWVRGRGLGQEPCALSCQNEGQTTTTRTKRHEMNGPGRRIS